MFPALSFKVGQMLFMFRKIAGSLCMFRHFVGQSGQFLFGPFQISYVTFQLIAGFGNLRFFFVHLITVPLQGSLAAFQIVPEFGPFLDQLIGFILLQLILFLPPERKIQFQLRLFLLERIQKAAELLLFCCIGIYFGLFLLRHLVVLQPTVRQLPQFLFIHALVTLLDFAYCFGFAFELAEPFAAGINLLQCP